MALDAKELAAGKCFLSNGNFVRRIIAIDDDQVTFEERGSKPVPPPWQTKDPVTPARFADDVTRVVPDDFDTETPG